MRLIDADKLRKEIHMSYSDNLGIREVIDEQNTVYDVNKVVDEIREYADNVAEFGGNFLPKIVIEIVKSGGIADD